MNHNKICKNCKNEYFSYHKTSSFCSNKCKHQSEQWKELGRIVNKIPHIPWNKGKKGLQISHNKGKKLSEETKIRISKSKKGKSSWNKGFVGYNGGEEHYNWKGGISSTNRKIRQIKEYQLWRYEIFTRDNYTCQECGIRGCYLEAHHIIAFAKLIQKYGVKNLEQARICKELWEMKNGQTLCLDCHNLTKQGRNTL